MRSLTTQQFLEIIKRGPVTQADVEKMKADFLKRFPELVRYFRDAPNA